MVNSHLLYQLSYWGIPVIALPIWQHGDHLRKDRPVVKPLVFFFRLFGGLVSFLAGSRDVWAIFLLQKALVRQRVA